MGSPGSLALGAEVKISGQVRFCVALREVFHQFVFNGEFDETLPPTKLPRLPQGRCAKF